MRKKPFNYFRKNSILDFWLDSKCTRVINHPKDKMSERLLTLRFDFMRIQKLLLLSFTAWKVSVFRVFLVRIFPYLDWIWENMVQKNCEYGHFSRSVCCIFPHCLHGTAGYETLHLHKTRHEFRSVWYSLSFEWKFLLF